MKNVLNKLNLIMQEVERIERDAENSFQKYKYASEKAIKEALHDVLVKHKVIFAISTSNPRIENSVTWIDVEYYFYDVDSGEFLKGTFIGSGSARDEKGHYSAVTGAIKYILTSTFLIPTGDDPEDDKNENTAIKPIAKQVAKTQAPKQAALPEQKPTIREPDAFATMPQLRAIFAIAKQKFGSKTKEEARDAIAERLKIKVDQWNTVTKGIASQIIEGLNNVDGDVQPQID